MPVKVGQECLFIFRLKKNNNSLCPAYGNKKGQGNFAVLGTHTKSQNSTNSKLFQNRSFPAWSWKGNPSKSLWMASVLSLLGTLTAQQIAGVQIATWWHVFLKLQEDGKQGQESVWREMRYVMFHNERQGMRHIRKDTYFFVDHETWRDCFWGFFRSLNFCFQDELACGWDPFTTFFAR